MNHNDDPAKFATGEKPSIVADYGVQAALELKTGTTVVERYRVIELLGKGGMGSVYKVEEIATGTKFALKFLDKQQTNEGSWKRFENEIKAANKLDHPNLIKLHESGLLSDGQPYFIMDLVEGESLSQILRKRGRLPLETVLKNFSSKLDLHSAMHIQMASFTEISSRATLWFKNQMPTLAWDR